MSVALATPPPTARGPRVLADTTKNHGDRFAGYPEQVVRHGDPVARVAARRQGTRLPDQVAEIDPPQNCVS